MVCDRTLDAVAFLVGDISGSCSDGERNTRNEGESCAGNEQQDN